MDTDKLSYSERKRLNVRAMIASGKWHADRLGKDAYDHRDM